MTPKAITKARKIIETATPGPWEFTDDTNTDLTCWECGAEYNLSSYRIISKDKYQVLECHLYGMERFCKADAEFIAAASTGWLEALDEIDRLNDKLEVLKI